MRLMKLQLAKATREVYECLHLANCEKGSTGTELYGFCVDAKNALEDAQTLARMMSDDENRTPESEDES